MFYKIDAVRNFTRACRKTSILEDLFNQASGLQLYQKVTPVQVLSPVAASVFNKKIQQAYM